MSAFTKPVFVNDNEPDLSAETLNPVMDKIEELDRFMLWNSAKTYALNDPALRNGLQYRSLVASNTNLDPATNPNSWRLVSDPGAAGPWISTRTYGTNDPVLYAGIPYRSLSASNTGNQPDTNPDDWEVVGGSGQGVENFLRNSLTKANTTGVTATGLTSAAWDTSATAQKLLAAGALKAVVPASGTRTLDVALSDLDALSVGQPWEVKFGYLIDTAGADGLVAVSLYDGTTDVATSLGALPYAGGGAQMTVGAVIPTTTLVGQRLRFTFSGAVAFNFYLAKAGVGPKSAIVAPAVGRDLSYTPTVTGLGSGGYSGLEAHYRINGDHVRIWGKITKDATAGTGAAGVCFSMPPDCKTSLSYVDCEGSAAFIATANKMSTGLIIDSNTFAFRYLNNLIVGSDMAANTVFVFSIDIPLSNRSVNVNLASEATVYRSHNGTSEEVGLSGSLIPTTTPSGTSETYTLNFPGIQASDMFVLELQAGGVGPWVIGGGTNFDDLRYDGTNYIGAKARVIGSSVVITRGKYAQGVNSAWSSISANSRWRARKVSGGNMAEVPPTVRAEYTNVANSGIGVANFNTKVEDTHGAVTTGSAWKFTAPVSMIYHVHGMLALTYSGLVTVGYEKYVGGSGLTRWLADISNPSNMFVPFSFDVRLNAGDSVAVKVGQAALVAASASAWITITGVSR